MTGKYKEVWNRQQGRCYYCGRPILPDQPRDVVQINVDGPALPSNFAYVHEICKPNELTVREVLGDVSAYTHRELLEGEQEIMTALGPQSMVKLAGPLRDDWIYMPLKKWFARQKRASFKLTFHEIEDNIHRPPSKSVKQCTAKWYPRPDQNSLPGAWLTEGYELDSLRLDQQKVSFQRVGNKVSHVKLPDWLTAGKIPDEARPEIEDYFQYIKKKYRYN